MLCTAAINTSNTTCDYVPTTSTFPTQVFFQHASFKSVSSRLTVRNASDKPCEITSCFAFSRLAIQRCSRAG